MGIIAEGAIAAGDTALSSISYKYRIHSDKLPLFLTDTTPSAHAHSGCQESDYVDFWCSFY